MPASQPSLDSSNDTLENDEFSDATTSTSEEDDEAGCNITAIQVTSTESPKNRQEENETIPKVEEKLESSKSVELSEDVNTKKEEIETCVVKAGCDKSVENLTKNEETCDCDTKVLESSSETGHSPQKDKSTGKIPDRKEETTEEK